MGASPVVAILDSVSQRYLQVSDRFSYAVLPREVFITTSYMVRNVEPSLLRLNVSITGMLGTIWTIP